MAQYTIYCPVCGKQTVVDEKRDKNYCMVCGEVALFSNGDLGFGTQQMQDASRPKGMMENEHLAKARLFAKNGEISSAMFSISKARNSDPGNAKLRFEALLLEAQIRSESLIYRIYRIEPGSGSTFFSSGSRIKWNEKRRFDIVKDVFQEFLIVYQLDSSLKQVMIDTMVSLEAEKVYKLSYEKAVSNRQRKLIKREFDGVFSWEDVHNRNEFLKGIEVIDDSTLPGLGSDFRKAFLLFIKREYPRFFVALNKYGLMEQYL